MKRKSKFILIAIILSLFCTLYGTSAYFTTSTPTTSIFNTKSYSFTLNGTGGRFNEDQVKIVRGQTTLPTPIKSGYTFLGYSNSVSGNTNYPVNINDVNQINNKEIYAKWGINTYSISYNLNGGTISGNKTSYNVEESFTLPTPSKNGYSFAGWTGSNGNTRQLSVTIPKGTINDLSYIANWNVNSYNVDINPVINGITYNSGLSGYTFDVWVDGVLVADNVIDWCQNVNYGSSVRVVSNGHDGMNTNFDKTITVGSSSTSINPSWSKRNYNVNYYVNGDYYTTSSVGYGDSVPAHSYSLNPWEVWDGWNNIPSQMPSWDIRVDGYYHEANCYVWAGHPKAQNGYAVMTNVVSAARHEFTGVVGPYEGTNINGVPLWIMNTDSSLKYSQVMAKLPTSMNRYTWWSYAEIHCDNGYAVAYTK